MAPADTKDKSKQGEGTSAQAGTSTTTTTTAAADDAKKTLPQLGALEEDDEFEEVGYIDSVSMQGPRC